jgi:hypothetical protein
MGIAEYNPIEAQTQAASCGQRLAAVGSIGGLACRPCNCAAAADGRTVASLHGPHRTTCDATIQ